MSRNAEKAEVSVPEGYDIRLHPFFKKQVEFTGTMALFMREEARQIVTHFGGHSKDSISKSTDDLVTGCQDLRGLASGTSESNKLQKARTLKENGSQIQIISETDFTELIFHPVKQDEVRIVRMQSNLNLDFAEDITVKDCTNNVETGECSVDAIGWIVRSYESSEVWKTKAEEVFCAVNGDSTIARNRVASLVRKYFIEVELKPEDTPRWSKDKVETVRILPPRISDSNATYVDWIHIADFLLLKCASVTDEIDAENQRREKEFQDSLRSYNLRVMVEDARAEIVREPGASDETVLTVVKKVHSGASMATIKQARKLERLNVGGPKPRKPERSPMQLYVPSYFSK